MRDFVTVVATIGLLLSVGSASCLSAAETGGIYYDLGIYAFEEKQFDKAKELFEKALSADPRNPRYLFFLGRTYSKMERFGDAERYLEQALAMDPALPGLTYERAWVKFKQSQFERSAELFEEAVVENPANLAALYYGGISYYKLEDYGQSIGCLERVKAESANLKALAAYHLGLAYLNLRKIDPAIQNLEYARDNAATETLKANTQYWLSTIESQKKALRPLSLFAKIGPQYNDNVRLEPLDEDFFSDEKDAALVFFFSGRYNLLHRANYLAGVGYGHYQTFQSALKEYNLIGSLGSLYGRLRIGKALSFGLSYQPAYYWLDQERYLLRHLVQPDVSWLIQNPLVLQLAYNYAADDHFTNDDRDGQIHAGIASLRYTTKNRKGLVTGTLGFEGKDALGNDFDYNKWIAGFNLRWQLPRRFTFGLMGRFNQKKYTHEISAYGELREDHKYAGMLTLAHPIAYDWLSIEAQYDYIFNDSNIDDYRYQQNIVMLSLIATY
jgi:tetratricopeptide (TPR) repeat protein